MSADAQVNPLPKAARQMRSPSLIFPASQASVRAMGIEAAVVFPYFMMLLNTFSAGSSRRWRTASEIRRLAWWGISRSMVFYSQSRFVQGFLNDFWELLYGKFEHVSAIHDGIMRPFIQHIMRKVGFFFMK